jgi:hypothetical protein
VERAAVLDGLLRAAVLSSDGGAPVELGRGAAVISVLGALRSGGARLLFPVPASVGRRIRRIKFLRRRMLKIGATTTAAFGVGPWVPVIGDFPLARGLLSIQGKKGRSSDGAPPTAPGRRRVRVAEGLGCIFVFLRGPFCNLLI